MPEHLSLLLLSLWGALPYPVFSRSDEITHWEIVARYARNNR